MRKTALYSLLGLPLLIFGLIGPTRAPYPGIAVVITLLLVFVASSLEERASKRKRAEAPLRWREHKSALGLFFGVTGGALGTHLRKLEDAGYITAEKAFVGRRPRTTYRLALQGSRALSEYVNQIRRLIAAVESELDPGSRNS